MAEEEAFKVPWIDPRDVKYIGHGLYRVTIYLRRRFYYDLFVTFEALRKLA